MILSFSRDLSALKNKTDNLVPANTEINGIKLPFWSVPVTLGETIHDVEDRPKVFAAGQEESRIDHDLQAIVSSLRQHKIRALIIDASNNLDILFLLEYFLRVLPNMRFVTLQSDHLAIGRSQNVELTGIVAITGLPLLRDMTVKLGLDPNSVQSHVFFESNDTEGTYLAAAMLLRGTAFHPTLDDAKNCAMSSVVGRSEFRVANSPVAKPFYPCVGQEPADRYSMTVDSGPGRGAPRSWVLTLLVVLVATAFHFAFLWQSNLFEKPDGRGTAKARFAYPGPAGIYEGHRLGILLALNSQYLILSIAVWAVGETLIFQNQFDKLAIFAQVILHVAIFYCIIFSFLLIKQGLRQERREHFFTLLGLSTLYTAGTLAMGYHLLWAAPGRLEHNSNALRIALLTEGLSPFLPFLAVTIAFIVYCWMELNNISWAARRRITLETNSNIHSHLDGLYWKLHGQLDPFSKKARTRILPALLAVLGTGIAFHLQNALTGFDGRFFKCWLIVFGFGACLVLIGFSVLRAWYIWRALRALLRWLRNTQLQPAFKQLHECDLPKLRIWDLGRRDQDLSILTRTTESVEALLGERAAAPARRALNQIRTDEIKEKQHCPKQAHELFNHLNIPLDDALVYLEHLPQAWDRMWLEKQRYLALRFVGVVRYSLLSIRNMYTFVVYGFALLTACAATYPFEGKSNLTALLTTVFLFIFISVGAIFYEIQKDTILSLIENTAAGEVMYGDLFKHLLSVGGIPALIVLATQFPSVAQLLLSWAKPGLDLVK